MAKSTRHSKITGDFAESLVLYWLSKSGYECACVDHTGIDIIACNRDGSERLGISVKSRSRNIGQEEDEVNLPPDGFSKARSACKAFSCVLYYAIVVDGVNVIRCFLLKLDHLENIASGKGKLKYWQMKQKSLKGYSADTEIRQFELRLENSVWPNAK